MPVSYSGDLRHRVITAWLSKEGSQRKLAERFKVSLSFVRNLLRHYRQSGQIEAKQRGGYQKPTIEDKHLSMIKSWVEEKNDLLLSELCDTRSVSPLGYHLQESTGIRVSISTMHRGVEKLDLRCKKKVSMQVSKILHEYRNFTTEDARLAAGSPLPNILDEFSLTKTRCSPARVLPCSHLPNILD